MKYKILLAITLIFLMTINICGCKVSPSVTPSKDGFNLEEIEEFILRADYLRFLLSTYEKTEIVIGSYGAADVFEIKSDYSTYEDFIELIGDYYSEELYDMLLSSERLVNLEGTLGCVETSGENEFNIEENSKFKLVADENRKKVVEILMFGDLGEERYIQYEIETDLDDKWKIVKIDNFSGFKVDRSEYNIYIRDWDSIEASSTLDHYNVNLMNDGNKDTSWSEGVDDDGVYEWVKFEKDHEYEVSGIKIINGYAETDDLYYENNRVKKIRIEFSDETFIEKTLKDDQRWHQEIMFNKKVKTKYVKITILDVYKGTKYRDTCIAELIVFN